MAQMSFAEIDAALTVLETTLAIYDEERAKGIRRVPIDQYARLDLVRNFVKALRAETERAVIEMNDEAAKLETGGKVQ